MERAPKDIEDDLIERGIIPPGARLVRTSGLTTEESLDDEYNPSPEREARFIKSLHDLNAREKESAIDDLDVRL